MKFVRQSFCILLVGLVLLFAGCQPSEREYHPDITLQLEKRDAELVVREWRYLMGSGADIYFRRAGEMVLLGSTTGGDDGYCPFAHGKYSVVENGDTVTVKWLFQSASDTWKEIEFALPD